MISMLRGTIVDITEKYIVIDVAGVGYKVSCTKETLSVVHDGIQTSIHTYLVVREDALDLYGFATTNERAFFELLISVSGIGPKSALTILSTSGVDTLTQAIGTGDTGYLTKVGGIGRKTAEKIVLELRDKLRANVDIKKESSNSLRTESDIIEALKALGYSQNEAREAIQEVPDTILGPNARIKEALKILVKK